MLKKEINLKNRASELNFQLRIHYAQNGIQSVCLDSSEEGFSWSFHSLKNNSALECSVNQWLDSFCQKRPLSTLLPFDWTVMTPFTRQVLQAVATIAFGSVMTYGQVADLIGRKDAARAVGGACRRNPFLLFIPCHRVLDAKFGLRGYSAGGVLLKEKLLCFEGVKTGGGDLSKCSCYYLISP